MRSEPTKQDDIERDRISLDAQATLYGLITRVHEAAKHGDAKALKWLHLRIVAIERDAQKRENAR